MVVVHGAGPAEEGPAERPARPGAPAGDLQVMIFETNAEVLDLLYEALPEAWGAQSFAALEDANGAPFHPKYGLVLVLGPSQVSDATLERVSAVLKTVPAAAAVLVVERPSAELMRVALRAGVDDAVELSSVGLHLANTVSELADRLERELADAAVRADDLRGVSSPRRGLVTSVFSPKGGVGKSVISVNLAAALARRTGEPVVILDLDLQFGDVAVMLRLQPLHTFRDAVSAGNLLDQALLGGFLARHEKSGVYVLAAPTSPEVDQVDPVAMLSARSSPGDVRLHRGGHTSPPERSRPPGGGGERHRSLRGRHGRPVSEERLPRIADLRVAAAAFGESPPALEPGPLPSALDRPRYRTGARNEG